MAKGRSHGRHGPVNSAPCDQRGVLSPAKRHLARAMTHLQPLLPQVACHSPGSPFEGPLPNMTTETSVRFYAVAQSAYIRQEPAYGKTVLTIPDRDQHQGKVLAVF